MFNKQNGLAEDLSSNFRAVRDWELVTGLTIWAHWIACFAGIVIITAESLLARIISGGL